MKRLLQTTTFTTLAIALHAAVAAYAFRSEGSQAGGVAGEAMVSLVGSNFQIEQIVEDWETSPALADVVEPPLDQLVPDVPDAPRMPSVDLAIAPSAAIQIASLQAPDRLLLPEVDTTSFTPPPAPEPKPEVKAEPEPKPDEVKKPKPEPKKAEEKTLKPKKTPKAKVATTASAPVREQKAAGTGGTSQAGVGKNDVTTLGKGQERKLFAKWGARIRSKVERQQRYPRGQKGKAKVIVAITVSNSGQLKGVRVARSSGIPAFDTAALAAVKRARKFPKAPKGLNAPSYGFNLPMTFYR